MTFVFEDPSLRVSSVKNSRQNSHTRSPLRCRRPRQYLRAIPQWRATSPFPA